MARLRFTRKYRSPDVLFHGISRGGQEAVQRGLLPAKQIAKKLKIPRRLLVGNSGEAHHIALPGGKVRLEPFIAQPSKNEYKELTRQLKEQKRERLLLQKARKQYPEIPSFFVRRLPTGELQIVEPRYGISLWTGKTKKGKLPKRMNWQPLKSYFNLPFSSIRLAG
jgi:hypothetical protein